MSESKTPRKMHIVFDGPPGPEAGRFVEVEDEHGKGMRVGKWGQRGEHGFWHLIIDVDADLAAARAEVERLRKDAARWDWLRSKTRGERSVDGRGQFVVPNINPVGGIMTGSIAEHFDAAIDAALAAKEPT